MCIFVIFIFNVYIVLFNLLVLVYLKLFQYFKLNWTKMWNN